MELAEWSVGFSAAIADPSLVPALNPRSMLERSGMNPGGELAQRPKLGQRARNRTSAEAVSGM